MNQVRKREQGKEDKRRDGYSEQVSDRAPRLVVPGLNQNRFGISDTKTETIGQCVRDRIPAPGGAR